MLMPCLLDAWLARLVGVAAQSPDLPVRLADCQTAAVARTLARARRSRFYARRLASCGFDDPGAFRNRADLARIPFTSAADLNETDWRELLCVGLDDVARMVTLHTSGTTGQPKRLAFSAGDLERTLDFFATGMQIPARSGDTVLVLLPGAATPGGVADLLIRALERFGARGVAGDPRADPPTFLEELHSHLPRCLVAAPRQLQRLLAPGTASVEVAAAARSCLRSLLSSAEPLPGVLREKIGTIWGCEVFDHWGMTETGYGGGVECACHDGYHLREADLLLEIVDPLSGELLPDGISGEIVITTLTREAMPLIRYRTGDVGSLLPGPCACGSPLRRLGPVRGRVERTSHGWRCVAKEKGEHHARTAGATL